MEEFMLSPRQRRSLIKELRKSKGSATLTIISHNKEKYPEYKRRQSEIRIIGRKEIRDRYGKLQAAQAHYRDRIPRQKRPNWQGRNHIRDTIRHYENRPLDLFITV